MPEKNIKEEEPQGKDICCNNPESKQHEYQLSKYCGVQVCVHCEYHKGLAKCYCGWNLAPGERLDDDVEY